MMTHGKNLTILIGGLVLLAAQASPASPGGTGKRTAGAAQAGKPTPPPVSDYLDYRIGPGDVLSVDVWKEPEASVASVVVRPDGRISLPIIGEMAAAGMTPLELQESASKRFDNIIRDARVTVSVREVNSQRVYVVGEVRRPGTVRLTAPLTVLQTLAEAGGLTEFAKRKMISILRVQDGRQIKLPFDYDAVLRGQKVEQNIVLRPGDTIVVPQ